MNGIATQSLKEEVSELTGGDRSISFRLSSLASPRASLPFVNNKRRECRMRVNKCHAYRFSPLSDITPGASMPALAASGHVCMVSTIFEWWTT
jgi:hypothetical protein